MLKGGAVCTVYSQREEHTDSTAHEDLILQPARKELKED